MKVLGKVALYKQKGSQNWYARFYINRVQFATSTKTPDLMEAEKVAENFYIETKMKLKNGTAPTSQTRSFKVASTQCIKQYKQDADRGLRSQRYVRELEILFRKLNSIIGGTSIDHIDQKTWNTVKQALLTASPSLSHKTLHSYKSAIQSCLSQAVFRGDLKESPRFQREITPVGVETSRTWFNREEYKELRKALDEKIKEHKTNKTRWVEDAIELKNFVIFGINSGLRVFEQLNIRFCDCDIVKDYDPRFEVVDKVLHITSILGKRTRRGQCKTYFGAVPVFKRIIAKNGLTLENYKSSVQPLFSSHHRDMFREILTKANLRFTNDRPPLKRDLKSLRSTFICYALLRKIPVYDIAANCRTSVQMVEQNYARHMSILSANVNSSQPKRSYEE